MFEVEDDARFNKIKFTNALISYNYPPFEAELISNKILEDKKQTLTIRYQLLDSWDDMSESFARLGVSISHCLPKPKRGTDVILNLEQKIITVDRLNAQFRSIV